MFVRLAYTPFVMHYEGNALYDHCGRAIEALETLLDDEGSVLVRGPHGVGVLDDRAGRGAVEPFAIDAHAGGDDEALGPGPRPG